MKQPAQGKSRPTSRSVEMPADLDKSLRASATAYAIFQDLPPSHQREYVQWIEEAKKEETRRNRIQKTVAMLLEKADGR